MVLPFVVLPNYMTHSNYNLFNPTAPLIFKAQQNLVKPKEFYQACQTLQQTSQSLYFTLLDRPLHLSTNLSDRWTFHFLDYLAQKLKRSPLTTPQKWQVYKVKVRLKTKTVTALKIARQVHPKNINSSQILAFQITLKPAGEGAIGRVLKIRINGGEPLAFKTFFDPDFVWQHGPWAEIPLGLWLTAQNVTKDLPEFKFSGQHWAVWEWIDDHTSPHNRSGLTYAEFAQTHQLTPLNPLNRSNYNAHNIRLDLGGIQQKYPGRRWFDIINSSRFYGRKLRREGWDSFKPYWSWTRWRYLSQRLWREVAAIAPRPILRKRSRRMF
jgi:hypothetical protein